MIISSITLNHKKRPMHDLLWILICHASLCIDPPWIMRNVRYLHCPHLSESTHLYSQKQWQLYFLHPPRRMHWCCTHTLAEIFMDMCVKPKMPAKTSWWEDTFSSSHALSLIPSAFLCLALCHSLVLPVSLCTDMFLIWLDPLHSVILNRASWGFCLCSCCFILTLLSKSLYRQVLRLPSFPFHCNTLVSEVEELYVGPGFNAPRYTAGYESSLIPPLIWFD